MPFDESSELTDINKEDETLKNMIENKVCDFCVFHIGLTALHPNYDPTQWPERLKDIIDKECLRYNIKDIKDEDLPKHYEKVVNLVHSVNTERIKVF